MPRQDLIAFRAGTAAQWAAANPVLAVGEAGFATDTGELKVGDGTTAWNSLTGISGGGGSVSWGDILGTLADQTDLQAALDARLEDAPSDGSTYARINGAWQSFVAGGSPTWGSVTGTLSNQTDLQSELDGKAGTSHTHTLSDVTDSGALAALDTVGTAQVDDEAVTLPKLAHMATDSLLGRDTAGVGDVEVLGPDAVRGILNVADGATADQSLANADQDHGANARRIDGTGGLTIDEQGSTGLEDSVVEVGGVAPYVGITARDSSGNANTVQVTGTAASVQSAAGGVNVTGQTGATLQATTGDVAINSPSGSVLINGTATGAFTAADESKLDGIEAGATADQTDGEIETAYNSQVAQVSPAERTAGTETAVRRFSPADIASMAGTHGGGGGGDHGGLTGLADDDHPQYHTDARGDARYSQLGHTHTLADVTDSGALAALNTVGTTGLDDSAVTNAKLADVPANTIKGRQATTGAPVDLSAANVRALINVEDGATADQTGAEIKAAYEAEANTNAFTDAEQTKLAGIATGATNNTGALADLDSVDTPQIDAAAVGTTQLADEAVTLAKLQHIATDTLLGRDTAATGDVEALTPAQVRGILNVADGATADQNLANADQTMPNATRSIDGSGASALLHIDYDNGSGQTTDIFVQPSVPRVLIQANDGTGANSIGVGSDNIVLNLAAGHPLLINGSAGTDGQVLTSGGAGAVPTWETPPGAGSGTTVGLLSATRSTGVALSTSLTTFAWDSPALNQDTWTYSAGVFTVPSGLNGAHLEFSVHFEHTDVGVTNRVQLAAELQKDTGTGYTTVARFSNYTARNATQGEGGIHLNYIDPTAAATGDDWRVQILYVGNAVTTSTNGCFISIKSYS